MKSFAFVVPDLCCAPVATAGALRVRSGKDLPQTNVRLPICSTEPAVRWITSARAIAVVTIKTLDDVPIQVFSQLWDSWKIGQKDRGILILLAVQDHKRWITTGYGLEAILPDSRVGDIGRQMVPYLRSGDYDDAVSLAVGQISQIIARDAGVTLQPLSRRGPPQRQAVRLSLGQLIVFAIIIFLVILFLARAGGSGLLGFLLGMFSAAAVGAVAVVVEEAEGIRWRQHRWWRCWRRLVVCHRLRLLAGVV